MRKTFAVSFGLVLFALPFISSADTASDLQAQIQNLLAQVKQLQTQLLQLQINAGLAPSNSAGGAVPTPPPPPAPTPAPVACSAFSRVLGFGESGADVINLQQFLQQQGAFSGQATGFFGPQTQAAVQAWQSQNGVVSSGDPTTTGWGLFGPASRALLSLRCGGTSGPSDSQTTVGVGSTLPPGIYAVAVDFSTVGGSATGDAPLVVTFLYSAFDSSKTYTIDFGDGQSGSFQPGGCPSVGYGPCSSTHADHTYAANGTYTAKLLYQPPMPTCPTGLACAQVMPAQQTIGTVTITVGRVPICDSCTVHGNFSASPTSGAAPLAVNFWYYIGGGTTDGYSIDFGDGANAVPTTGCANNPASGLGACPRGVVASHTYTSAGTYTANLIQKGGTCTVNGNPTFCGSPDRIVDTVTITVGSAPICEHAAPPSGCSWVSGATCSNDHLVCSSTTGAPVVNGVDGPASLAVGQQGTWSVHASVAGNADQNIRYSAVWGDEARDAFAAIQSLASGVVDNVQTSASFTHIYARAGTYRPTFTATNNAGSAQTSATIVVGTSATGVSSSFTGIVGGTPVPAQTGYSTTPTFFGGSSVTPAQAAGAGGGCSWLGVPYASGQVVLGGFSSLQLVCNNGTVQLSGIGAPTPVGSAQTGTSIGGSGVTPLPAQPSPVCVLISCASGFHASGPQCSVSQTCVQNTTTTSGFFVFPTSGASPFKATFTLTGGTTSNDSVDFGDGSPASSAWSPDAESNSVFLTHTYASAGTYTATLTSGNFQCSGSSPCPPNQTLGSVTITVTGSSSTGNSFGGSSGSATDANANLANALTALEAALKAFISSLGR